MKLNEALNEALNDLFFPKDESCVLCGELSADLICKKCQKELLRYEYKNGNAVYYYGGIAEKTVKGLKFNQKTYLAPIMAELMKEKAFASEFDYIVPVPLFYLRKLSRGYNQSALIAKYICKERFLEPLKRIRYTKKQTKLTGTERIENVKDAFAVKKDYVEKISGKRILLIDDVYTTGSTSKECVTALKKCGVEDVRVLTFTRVH